MAGVNFEKNLNVAETTSSIADGIFISIKDEEVPAGQSRYIVIDNISELPLKLSQILLLSSCPDVSVDGKAEISLQIHFNTLIDTELLGAPNTTIYSNSFDGTLYNIKGFLVDAREVSEFDTLKYDREILLDSHCIANNEATGLYLPQNQKKSLNKPLVIGANKQVVIRISNSNITETGIGAVVNITLAGQFKTNKQGLPVIPITADSVTITTDTEVITVDQTEI